MISYYFLKKKAGYWKAETGRSLEARSLGPAWPTWQNPMSTKNTKSSWTWWCTPIIPATREVEVAVSRDHSTGQQGRKFSKKEFSTKL